MRSLIIGGTSGLGLAMARLLHEQGDEIIITGRKNPDVAGLQFQRLDLDQGTELSRSIETFVLALPKIDRLVYAAGFYQEGSVTELEYQAINNMLDVGLHAPIWFVRHLLQSQRQLDQFIAITSSAQYKPRPNQSIYAAAKAGLSQFANSVSQDERIGKVLVAAPEGMKTPFWHATGQKTDSYNDPDWVAHQIVEALAIDFNYVFVKILRNPPRTEVVETR